MVKTAARCSSRAFEELMERHHRLLRITLGRYAGNTADREDLRQDLIVALLADGKKAIAAWRPIAPFSAYLATIASRQGMRFARRRDRLNARTVPVLPAGGDGVLDNAPLAELVAQEPGPSDLVEAAESRKMIVAAMAGLSDRDQLVLRLRYFADLDGPGVARVLGISHGAARKAIFDALRRLRRAVEEAGAVAGPAR